MIAFATNLRKRRLRSLSAYQAPDNSLVIGTCPKGSPSKAFFWDFAPCRFTMLRLAFTWLLPGR